jgi:tRNA U34 5-methylaminomethyl-2-thiouridine-forming methyltransferase MnmC
MISSAVPKEASKWQKQKKDDDIDSIIMALQAGTHGPEEKKVRIEEISATTMVNTSALKSIIGRVRNGQEKDQPAPALASVSIEPDSNNRMDKEVRTKPNPYLNAMIAAAMCSDTGIL